MLSFLKRLISAAVFYIGHQYFKINSNTNTAYQLIIAILIYKLNIDTDVTEIISAVVKCMAGRGGKVNGKQMYLNFS